MTEVVVDNGKAFVSEESATIATEAAAQAKQWAEESETQANSATNSANIAYQARNEAVNAVNGFTQTVTEATNTFNSNATAKTTAFNDNYTEKKALIDAQVAIAENSATNANNYKNKAREWAISQNVVDNEDYSSKYWAGKSKEWAESVSSPLNKNLSNLNPQGQNIANWSTNVTNCITEIPQDIKLELNDGTLTLKAGSKVYVPNGAVFDVVNVSSNIKLAKNSTGLYFVFMRANGVQSDTMPFSYCYSGNSQPTITHTYAIWYDTANNKIKWTKNNGSTWVDGYSLPICIVVNDTPGTQNVSSIDQVFNGFGYIGSTVFALPGVKGLIPNGRNADGTLKNIEFTVDSVKTATKTWVDNKNQVWGYIKNPPTGANETWYWNKYIESDEEPSYNEYTMWYKPSENTTYMNNGVQSSTPNWKKVNYINFGRASGINSQEIKIFTPKTAFHAVDYNDSSTISGWSMPSSRYVDLNLGASGATYTAPANGYFCLDKTGTQNEYIDIRNNTTGLLRSKTTISAPGTESIAVYMPCKKGDEIAVVYTATGTTNRFRFIYAEGENV